MKRIHIRKFKLLVSKKRFMKMMQGGETEGRQTPRSSQGTVPSPLGCLSHAVLNEGRFR